MSDFTIGKITGDTLGASEWNQVEAIKKAITSSGQFESSVDFTQLSKAMAIYAASSTYYTDSGSADAYVLSSINSLEAPSDYLNGMGIEFRSFNPNTGASTVNVAGLGVKDLKKEDGITDLDAGQISSTNNVIFRYDGAVFALSNPKVESATTTSEGVGEIATDAEAAAGTETGAKFLNPANLLSLFGAANIGTDKGTIKIPLNIGGAFVEGMIQFVNGTALNANQTLTFQEAFTTTIWSSMISGDQKGVASDDANYHIYSQSLSAVVVRYDDLGGGASNLYPIVWAIGY